MKTELVALKGKLYTKSFQLADGQKVVLGRGEDADLQVLDHGLSRLHCAFEKQGDRFFLEDLKSRNGTWVNGERIERREMCAGDVVKVGAVEFEFRAEPDRRRVNADLIAAVPQKPGKPIDERMELDGSDLMQLSKEFQTIENFRRIQRDLATIYNVGNLINAERDLDSLYRRIMEAILQVIKADRVYLLLADRDNRLQPVAFQEKPLADGATPGYSSTVTADCMRNRTTVLKTNLLMDERYAEAESVLSQRIHSVICVPIETPDRAVGCIYADTTGEGEPFTRHDLELLLAIGRQAGVAVQRVQFSDQLRQMLRGTVRALAAAIEAKDDYTRGHSERVTAYALQIGSAMALDEEELRTLELAGFLHDVGKIGVPENILRKAGPLTQEEYEIVKQHPSLGANIVRNIDGAEKIARVVLHHHERWDGKGYPDALDGDKPPVLSRILTVADAFDAMSSQRPYRDRLALEKVMRTMREGAGRQFDPNIVDVFLRIMADVSKAPSEDRRVKV